MTLDLFKILILFAVPLSGLLLAVGFCVDAYAPRNQESTHADEKSS